MVSLVRGIIGTFLVGATIYLAFLSQSSHSVVIAVAAANCPGGPTLHAYKRGFARLSSVPYSLQGIPEEARASVKKAFDEWNKVLKAPHDILFYQVEDTQAGFELADNEGVVFTVGPTVVTPGRPAEVDVNDHLTKVGLVKDADVVIDLNNTDIFDRLCSGCLSQYNDAVQKVDMHEIGHMFGLNEALGDAMTQEDRKSVMNAMHNKNDSGNNMPLTVPTCDVQALRTLWPFIEPGPGCDGDDCGVPCPLMIDSCGPPGPPPPSPGPTCSPSGEFLAGTDWYDCVDLCNGQISDSFSFCTGQWRTEMCAYRWGPNSCGVTSSRILGWSQEADGNGETKWIPIAMQPHSAVRECSGFSSWSPTYKQTSLECLQHCDANDADACEWNAANGDCYVEFGSGCQVEFGYYGWSAYVLNASGGSGGSGSSGTMFQNNAVSCSDWWWHSPVYKADAEQCGSHCQANGADACEWEASTGDCYVEFGNDCSLYGHGGWWSAVYDEEEPSGVMGSLAAAVSQGARGLLDLRLLVALIGVLSVTAVAGLVTLFRRRLLVPEGMAG